LSVAKGHMKVGELLIVKGADINSRGNDVGSGKFGHIFPEILATFTG